MCFLTSCIYARVLCILACCFDGVSLLLLSHVSAKSISYLIVLWSADRTVYLQIESETGGQRGRNPRWYCNGPDCRRGFTRPHVFRRRPVNGLRHVRLRVPRQNQRRVPQRVETILVLFVLVPIWLVARSAAEPLPSRSRERFAVSLATHSYSHQRKQLTSNKLAFSSGANFNARLWEAMLTRAKGALRNVERLTWLGCALQVNNTP